jgi:hypothetical protein
MQGWSCSPCTRAAHAQSGKHKDTEVKTRTYLVGAVVFQKEVQGILNLFHFCLVLSALMSPYPTVVVVVVVVVVVAVVVVVVVV